LICSQSASLEKVKRMDSRDLMCLYWTTAGITPGQGEISRFDFRERVEAASRAGFKGIGLWHTDLEHILYSRSLKEMQHILDDNGMQYLELEFLTDWFLEGQRKAESDSRKRRLFEASEALQASHVKVGDFYNSDCPMEHFIEAFAALCREAQAYHATIGYEIMGCARIDNLPEAVKMVETAGAANGGLIIDMYQVVHQRMTLEQIGAVPVEYLVGVELNDGFLPGSPGYDPSNRLFCGEGAYDLRGFIGCVQALGYAGPWGVEVISEKVARLPLEEASRRACATSRAAFDG
jgi:sugar phosphate isomerase/epimerase